MKILKPGKVEMRRFVCEKCGCVFAVERTRMYRDGHKVTTITECPCGWQMRWGDGEPYEEPTPTVSDRERLDRLLIPWTESNSLRGYCVEHLINSGVTFKEE